MDFSEFRQATMSASSDEEIREWCRMYEDELERRNRQFFPRMEDYTTRDYQKAHELFAGGELGKRVREAVGAEERQKMIEFILWVAWAYNQDQIKGPLLMYRKWQESMKEFEQQGYLAKLRQLKEIEHQSEMAKLRQLKEFEHQSQMAELRQLKEFEHQSLLAKVRQLREENQLLKHLQSSRMRCKATTAACAPPNSMKLQVRGQEEEEEIQNFNNVEGPEVLGDQRAKMCLKRTKDVSAGLQGTKKTRVSGQSSSQSNGQSQSDEPQPSNNSSAQQSICS